MLNSLVFANSLALTVIIFRIVAIVLSLIMPQLFGFLIRSFSLGLIGSTQKSTPSDIVISVLVPALAAWILAYVWAFLYNKWNLAETPKTTGRKFETKKTVGKK